jgi:hypothetical protein
LPRRGRANARSRGPLGSLSRPLFSKIQPGRRRDLVAATRVPASDAYVFRDPQHVRKPALAAVAQIIREPLRGHAGH